MSAPLTIDPAVLIPKVRAAFDAGELQCQSAIGRSGSCEYAGPCAVGIGFEPEERDLLDHPGFTHLGSPGIRTLCNKGVVNIIGGEAALRDLSALQGHHDAACTEDEEIHRNSLVSFEGMLQHLEALYACAD